MTEPITLDFLGHQARITRVLPSHPTLFVEKEGFTVVVEFEPPFNSTLSVYLKVPARGYSREAFIREVDAALRDWVDMEQQLKDTRAKREEAEAELKALATTLAAHLGLKGPNGAT